MVMAWLEVELSLVVRRLLAVMLAVWTWMMGLAGFFLLIAGLVLHGYVATSLHDPGSSTTSSVTSTSSSVVWFSYSVVVLGTLMTITYALASLVSTPAVTLRNGPPMHTGLPLFSWGGGKLPRPDPNKFTIGLTIILTEP